MLAHRSWRVVEWTLMIGEAGVLDQTAPSIARTQRPRGCYSRARGARAHSYTVHAHGSNTLEGMTPCLISSCATRRWPTAWVIRCGGRLVRRAPGLLATWVNGVKVFDGDDYTRVTPPGQVLTRFTGAPPRVGMQAR